MSILCYHAVDPGWRSAMSVPPEAFETHCAWLARRRTVLPLDEAVGRLDRSFRLPRGLVALTFDDGYASLFEHAAPALRRHRLPWTVFLVAQTLTPGGRTVDWVDDPPSWPLETLSTAQVLELQDAGATFGSHSLAHRDLTAIPEDECERDLRESREVLEDLLGRPGRAVRRPPGRGVSREPPSRPQGEDRALVPAGSNQPRVPHSSQAGPAVRRPLRLDEPGHAGGRWWGGFGAPPRDTRNRANHGAEGGTWRNGS